VQVEEADDTGTASEIVVSCTGTSKVKHICDKAAGCIAVSFKDLSEQTGAFFIRPDIPISNGVPTDPEFISFVPVGISCDDSGLEGFTIPIVSVLVMSVVDRRL
jgi:hypothetical protein